MTPRVGPIPGHETIDGETLYQNEIKKLKEALKDAPRGRKEAMNDELRKR